MLSTCKAAGLICSALFEQHLSTHSISYGTREEMQFRHEVFTKKEKYIRAQNDANNSYTLQHNIYSTWTSDEMQRIFSGPSSNMRPVKNEQRIGASNGIDWRAKGVLPPVRNQGACGSAAMFQVMDSVTAMETIDSGKMTELSMQQLMDCVPSSGCSGSSIDAYWDYVIKNGLMSAQDYPSRPSPGVCHFNPAKVTAHVSSVTKVVPDKVSTLEDAISVEPTLVGVHAGSMSF